MGCGAQERVEHVVFTARALGLSALSASTGFSSIYRCCGFLCLWVDGETASHHTSLPALALGLLASKKDADWAASRSSDESPLISLAFHREASLVRTLGRQRFYHYRRAARRRCGPFDDRVFVRRTH